MIKISFNNVNIIVSQKIVFLPKREITKAKERRMICQLPQEQQTTQLVRKAKSSSQY